MTSFPVPTRVSIEAPNIRLGAYVVGIAAERVWLHAPLLPEVRTGATVRMTFRVEEGPSLGISGKVVRSARESVGVQVCGPIDLAILRAWAEGNDADISPSQRLFTSETPTADVPRIPDAETQFIRGTSRDTLQDFVFSRPQPKPERQPKQRSQSA